MFAGEGNDLVDASIATDGGNQIFAGAGDDEIFAGSGDRVFGGDGDDLLNSAVGGGGNRLLGEDGDDILLAGEGDRLLGGNGDDTLFIVRGGNNILSGGPGADAFWIVNGELPTEANIITDFELEEDLIGVAGLGISSAEELTFTQVENDTTISFSDFDLAVLQNTQASDLPTNATFAFA